MAQATGRQAGGFCVVGEELPIDDGSELQQMSYLTMQTNTPREHSNATGDDDGDDCQPATTTRIGIDIVVQMTILLMAS